MALERIGPAAKTAVPTLIILLKDKSGTADTQDQVREAAAWGLGGIGPEAKTAVPVLTELLKDKAPGVRGAAATALGKIGFTARTAIPALTELLKDKDEDTRQAASQALDEINNEGKRGYGVPPDESMPSQENDAGVPRP